MKIVAEYRQRAEQCACMAGQMAPETQRKIFLNLAASWRRWPTRSASRCGFRLRISPAADTPNHPGMRHVNDIDTNRF